MLALDDIPEAHLYSSPTSMTDWAKQCLDEAEAVHKMRGPQPDGNKLKAEYDAWVKLMDLESRHVNAAILFAAMSIEASLNFHGVVLLGEDFFDANCERLEPGKKLSMVVGINEQKLMQPSDPIMGIVKRVAKARNAIAHPKTQAFTSKKQPGPKSLVIDPTIATARSAVKDMQEYFKLIKKLLPTSLHL